MNAELKFFLKVLFVFLLIACTVVPNSEIWNMKVAGSTDGFHVFFSVLDFVLEFVMIYLLGKHVIFKKGSRPWDD